MKVAMRSISVNKPTLCLANVKIHKHAKGSVRLYIGKHADVKNIQCLNQGINHVKMLT